LFWIGAFSLGEDDRQAIYLMFAHYVAGDVDVEEG
jgi:hypothetical protein